MFRDGPFNIYRGGGGGGYQKMTKNCLQEAKAGKNCLQIVCPKNIVCMAILKNLRISKYQPVAKMAFCSN